MNDKLDRTFLTSIALSFFTPSVIIGQKLGGELLELLEEMGKSSEEIFRGERLPLLKNHPHNPNSI
ncbi:hypothetical protein [Geminocystis sp. NIES-3709]|uniref:hypothetical protein n=1 Tax=Geminocystis sp. NIES-3709 TaxID=1617448 RepID=UPI0005FCC1F9|nr:hypothetical protein [Geminocystis sp. NIES-3709]BAQ65276.1 hypothetical protein GM3709_2041 [Geminocystis sp. NIES-3709]